MCSSDLFPSHDSPRINEYVFPANTKTGHIDDARRQFVRLSCEVNTTVTAHDLRRTFKSIASECNIELWKCKLLMNHQDSDVTITSYTETSDLRYLSPEVDKIAEWTMERYRMHVKRNALPDPYTVSYKSLRT